jgi:hypothetical protein
MLAFLKFAGIGCIAVGAVWELVAAYEGGFLTSLLWHRGDEDHARGRRSERDLVAAHWEDLKGPFYLIVFGAALMLCAERLVPSVTP